MRTIKFRGIDCEGNFVYGDLIHKRHCKEVVMIQDEKGLGSDVDISTVGQFAELYDKHDDEIYDGDFILSDKDNRIYYVTFKNGMFYASCHECNPNLHGGYPLWMLVDIGCSIIGNIYDNPDLLNNTKEK